MQYELKHYYRVTAALVLRYAIIKIIHQKMILIGKCKELFKSHSLLFKTTSTNSTARMNAF